MKKIFTLFVSLFFISWISQAQPTAPASAIVISPISAQTNQVRFDWTNGTGGTGRIVIVKPLASTFSPEIGRAHV